MRKKKLCPRWLAWTAAWWGGWFWLPCPNCGEMFAGFEASLRPGSAIPTDDPARLLLVCAPCGEKRAA